MRRKFPLVVAATAATLVLAACGGTSDAGSEGSGAEDGELTPVTVGVIPIVDVAPIYLGVEKGFFEDEGLDVTPELAQGGAAIVPAVVSGDYQFGFSNLTSLLVASSKGLPLKAVAAGNFTTGEPGEDFGAVVVPEDSKIKDAADLEGKTVAVNTLNNIGDTTIRKVVEEAGGDDGDVEFVELGFPDMPAAVDGGQVDAAWIVEPHLTVALEQGAKVVASNFAETVGGKIEQGETPLEALLRECEEEVGLRLDPADVESIGRFGAPAANEPDHVVDAHAFRVRLRQGVEIAVRAELEELVWIDPADPVLDRPIAQLSRDLLAAVGY